ncbi:MAG: hypothetical protein WCP21_15840 [Armatimonadota bacterium]
MRHILAGCLWLAALALPAHADWKLDRFMIGAWGSPTDEGSARTYVEAGFNAVMCKPDLLDLCARHGLRAIVFDTAPEKLAALKGHPGVWGWYAQDEPKAEEFPRVGERVAAYRAADANHPAYVNLMAWMDLNVYLKTVKPQFLSYDYYQWWWGPGNYCWRLEAHREAALKARLPLLCWIEGNADPRYEWGKPGAGYLEDNLPKLRQSVSLAVAYGVQGIQWFTGGLCIDNEGKLTRSGQDVATINHELQALGPVLLKLKSQAVYHTGPAPPHTAGVPESLWVQCRQRNLSLGLFGDAEGHRYLVVVNRDLARARQCNLHFRAVEIVRHFEVETERWRPVPLTNLGKGVDGAEVSIPAGGMALLSAR